MPCGEVPCGEIFSGRYTLVGWGAACGRTTALGARNGSLLCGCWCLESPDEVADVVVREECLFEDGWCVEEAVVSSAAVWVGEAEVVAD